MPSYPARDEMPTVHITFAPHQLPIRTRPLVRPPPVFVSPQYPYTFSQPTRLSPSTFTFHHQEESDEATTPTDNPLTASPSFVQPASPPSQGSVTFPDGPSSAFLPTTMQTAETALNALSSTDRRDVLLEDNNREGLSGLELHVPAGVLIPRIGAAFARMQDEWEREREVWEEGVGDSDDEFSSVDDHEEGGEQGQGGGEGRVAVGSEEGGETEGDGVEVQVESVKVNEKVVAERMGLAERNAKPEN